jgi:hypothetical protein
MSEMIERVARALCVAAGQDPDFNYDPHGINRTDDVRWRVNVTKARAAIEAMREPTEGMVYADTVKEWPSDACAAWKAMIDEALK